uniref:Cysteine-rich and transmembrane domain-containing protein 1 n=1 Tax=Meleagris gallopavo TaxID=9103 RepID=A0A803YH95_MELGA
MSWGEGGKVLGLCLSFSLPRFTLIDVQLIFPIPVSELEAPPKPWLPATERCRPPLGAGAICASTDGSSVPAVYVVEERRRDDSGESACLTACWTALCCCCLWDMLT